MLRRRPAVLTALMLALLGAACSAPAPLTLAEYAAWCAGGKHKILGVDEDLVREASWDELLELLEDVHLETLAIVPPEAARAYHEAQLFLLAHAIEVMQGAEPEGGPFDRFALRGIGLGAWETVAAAEASLTAEVRGTLQDAGCADAGDIPGAWLDRGDPAGIGERISVLRQNTRARFDLILHGRPERSRNLYRIEATVIAVTDGWSYTTNIWLGDRLELISAPDEQGQSYQLREVDSFAEFYDDALSGVTLNRGEQYRGALYFLGDAPDGVEWVELHYPIDGTTRVVDLTRGSR